MHSPDHLLDGQGRLWLLPQLMGARSKSLLVSLPARLSWSRPEVRVFGRRHPVPRLQCWMGNPECRYRYSGLALEPLPWDRLVCAVRDRIQQRTGLAFNSVLLNLYRDGEDRMGWHADDEPELGPEPWIASYSLGSARRFAFRRRGETRQLLALELAHDDLLLMGPEVQRRWQHALPPMRRVQGQRLNMTFRRIAPQRTASARLARGRGSSTP